jgi:TonB family protein
LALASGAVPAAAQEHYSGSMTPADWLVSEAGSDPACHISQEYEGEGTTTLGLSYDISGEGFLFLTNYNWSLVDNSQFDLVIRFEGRARQVMEGRASGFRSGTSKGFTIGFTGEEVLNRLSAASGIEFYRREGDAFTLIDDLSLEGSGEAVRRMRHCLSIVRRRVSREEADRRRLEHIPRDPFASTALAPPSSSIGARDAQLRSGTITNDDYPASAFTTRAEGTTTVLVSVGSQGRITNCVVTHSSGNPALDSTTCALMTRRFRFTPALDENGNPVASTMTRTHRWEMP